MTITLSIIHDGQGLFDHYFDNRDMVTYEAFFAGIKFQPYLARITVLSEKFNKNTKSKPQLDLQ